MHSEHGKDDVQSVGDLSCPEKTCAYALASTAPLPCLQECGGSRTQGGVGAAAGDPAVGHANGCAAQRCDSAIVGSHVGCDGPSGVCPVALVVQDGDSYPPLLDQNKCVQVVHTRSKDKARKKNPPSPGLGEGEDEGPPVSSRTRGRSKVGESSSSGPHVQFVTPPRIVQPSRLVQRPRMSRWRGHRLTRTHWMSMRHRKAL